MCLHSTHSEVTSFPAWCQVLIPTLKPYETRTRPRRHCTLSTDVQEILMSSAIDTYPIQYFLTGVAPISASFRSVAIVSTLFRLWYRWYAARMWWDDWAVLALLTDIAWLVIAIIAHFGCWHPQFFSVPETGLFHLRIRH
ncbi:hypothetical protein EV363DRAFT_869024 [Boletus edulis]|uniref:Uncharacterized protein n=1 Tax=Boletus edulis BED1 TaxID=1328754 RepID=A0AAD4BMD5_BOLED|nr:hypothetical protein EV363DRAFT_869024 [Boletus edulis]KAF8434782.1 hypothetical protein L210DRAFT_2564120 [Boletus edulis BED1]